MIILKGGEGEQSKEADLKASICNSPCTDGVGVNDLPLLVLQQVAVRAMEHTGSALGKSRCMLLGLNALASSLRHKVAMK